MRILLLLLLIASCLAPGGRQGRRIIQKYGGQAEETCTKIFHIPDLSCQDSCDEDNGYSLYTTEEEKQLVLDGIDRLLEDGDITNDEYEPVVASVNSSTSVCLQETRILRPNNAVFVDGNLCACKEGKDDIINSCDTFCSSKRQADSTLYGSVTLGPEVLLNKELGDLSGWCNNEIRGSDLTAPGCSLEIYDGGSTQNLPLNINGKPIQR